MRAAPAVSYPVRRSRFAVLLAALLWMVGAAAIGAWLAQVPAPGWQRLGAVLLLLAVGGAAAISLFRAPVGTLSWDGEQWWWQPAGGAPQPGQPRPVLDLQSLLLLQWQSATGGVGWIWLARAHAPLHWQSLRRAVHSRAAAAPGA